MAQNESNDEIGESSISIAEKDIESDDPKLIQKGVFSLANLMNNMDGFLSESLSDSTIPILCKITTIDIDFHTRNIVMEFIAELCKTDKAATHKIFQISYYDFLLEILAKNRTSFPLMPVVEILSSIVNWTRFSFQTLMSKGYFDLLLQKLANPELTVADQYGVLRGILSVLKSTYFNDPNLFIHLIGTISNYLIATEFKEATLKISYNIIGTAIGKLEDKQQLDFDLHPFFASSLQLLANVGHPKIRLSIVSFLCNSVFHFDDVGNFLIQNGLLDIFHNLWPSAPDKLKAECLRTCSNCTFSSSECNGFLSSTVFLDDAFGCLINEQTQMDTKAEALALFQRLLTTDSKFFVREHGLTILGRYPIFFDVLSNFLHLYKSTMNQVNAQLIYMSLKCFYFAIVIYGNDVIPNGELPNAVKTLLNDENFMCLQDLAEYNERSIQEIAQLLHKTVSEIAKSYFANR
ncbi:hypothetical protein GPJ56_007541 [Histomonas meleagridis]|uniref:uncharacterized protein n=1 Tax=Histomonas meleagridis TaxID=135588 RepID=UPI003559ECBC|nr:hypothetical protein GPJ56_007541 [Histomonas meleagridis]KAH0806060.1 hypothetical protein GO595_001073 [Histomonas meleagridis]